MNNKKNKTKILITLIVLLSMVCGFLLYYFFFRETYIPINNTVIEEVDDYVEPVKEYPFKEYDIESYHTELESLSKKYGVTGISLVVFHDEDIIDSFNYGYEDVENKVEVDDNTIFRIASVSKMISNIMVMKLVDEGEIELGSKLEEVTGLNYGKDVELWHILTHTSGIGDSGVFDNNLDQVYDINYLLNISKFATPGKVYSYSNFAAGTMAAIVESVTGKRFYDYADEVLFDYLDLNAGYLVEMLDENNNTVAKIYSGSSVTDPNTWMFNKDFYDKFDIGKQYRLAYGNLYISATDLAKIGMVLANNGTYKDKTVLSYNALNEIRTIRNVASGHPYYMGLNTDYFDDLVEGRRIFGHTGSAYGAITYLMYDPKDHTGVCMLTNGASSSKNDKGYNNLIYETMNLVYSNIFVEK